MKQPSYSSSPWHHGIISFLLPLCYVNKCSTSRSDIWKYLPSALFSWRTYVDSECSKHFCPTHSHISYQSLHKESYPFFLHQLIFGIFPWSCTCGIVAKDIGDIRTLNVSNLCLWDTDFLCPVHLIGLVSACTTTIMQHISAMTA